MLLHHRNGGKAMQTRECLRFSEYRDRERNEELIGVLTAISIVSKRLAGRLAALEQKPRGGRCFYSSRYDHKCSKRSIGKSRRACRKRNGACNRRSKYSRFILKIDIKRHRNGVFFICNFYDNYI